MITINANTADKDLMFAAFLVFSNVIHSTVPSVRNNDTPLKMDIIVVSPEL